MPLAGGIMQHGYQCGMIWGAALAAGARAYRLYGAGPRSETAAIDAAQRLVEAFRVQNTEFNCYEITELDRTSSQLEMIWYFFVKGGTIGCFRRAAAYAPAALREITGSFSQAPEEIPQPPVSCAALLATRLGASEQQRVMAAGLAGGIGLCGGACGALGAAIWLRALKNRPEKKQKPDFNSPAALALIETFLKYSRYEFECASIAQRRFENAADHAAYLRNGGCREIIEALAAG